MADKQTDINKKILIGLEKAYQKMIEFKKQKQTDIVILRGDKVVRIKPDWSRNTQIVFDIFRQISHKLNQTIIAVTHDNDFARASDRTIELEDGKVISQRKVFA